MPTPESSARPAPGLQYAAMDAMTMTFRSVRLSLRNVEGLITALVLPIMLMLMFVFLFGGAVSTGVRYVNYVAPGVLLVCVGFGTATTAVSVSHDLTGGIIDRFRSMDVSGVSLIAGHVMASVVRNVISALTLFGVAFAIGFHPHASPVQWAEAIGILVLFVLALSWFAAAVGIMAGSPEAASGATFLVSFLAYPSSAFVPINTMPSWLQDFARYQPFNTAIEALRGLLSGHGAGASAGQAVAWSVVIIAISVALAGLLFRHRDA